MTAEPESLWTNEDPRLHLAAWGGEGTPLLLVHGMAGNTHWWDTTAPLLTGAFRPVALDFRGHGDSDWRPEGSYDTAGFAGDIEEARHSLGWERMILCGHSLGGRIALEYAARHPERLIGLIAVDFLPEFYEVKSRRFEKTRTRSQPAYSDRDAMTARFHLEPSGTLLPGEDLKELARRSIRKAGTGFTWKFDWRAFRYHYGPIWPVLKDIKTPTLIVRGEKSAVMARVDVERIARELPGVRALEVPAAHHHVPLDAPKAMAGAIADFAQCLSPVT